MKQHKMLFKTRMEIFRGEALKEATKPLFSICKYMGIFPYDDDFTTSSYWLRYSIVISSLVVIVSGVLKSAAVFYYKPPWIPTLFESLLFLTEAVIEGAGFVAHIIALVYYRPAIDKVLVSLRDLPEHKPDNLFPKYGPWICLFKLITLYVKQMAFYPLELEPSNIIFYIVHFPNIIFYFINLEFCAILELLRYQLNLIIQELRPNEVKLVPLTKRHHLLVDLATNLNEIFSWQLLIICTRIFLKLVSTLYTCILKLKEGQMLEVLDTAWVCVWQVVLLFALAISCEDTKEKAETFNNELFKLMRESKDLCSNEKLHLYVTMKQTVNFTACGFFSLGYPLVTSIIAAATTYLVILVQFSMQGK